MYKDNEGARFNSYSDAARSNHFKATMRLFEKGFAERDILIDEDTLFILAEAIDVLQCASTLESTEDGVDFKVRL